MNQSENEFETPSARPSRSKQSKVTPKKSTFAGEILPSRNEVDLTITKLAERAKLNIAALPQGAFEEDRSDGKPFIAHGMFKAVVSALVVEQLAAHYVGHRQHLFQIHRSDVSVSPKSRQVSKVDIELTFAESAKGDFRDFASFLEANRHCFPPEVRELRLRVVGLPDFREDKSLADSVPVIEIRPGKPVSVVRTSGEKIKVSGVEDETWFSVVPYFSEKDTGRESGKRSEIKQTINAYSGFCKILAGAIAAKVTLPR